MSKGKGSIDNIASVVTNKRTRSLWFLIATFAMILGINGLLPMLSGQAHYTADVVEVTYREYLEMKEANNLIDLTYGSKLKIDLRIETWPDQSLTPEEIMEQESFMNIRVSIFTKFFFESPWWYIEMITALVSAVFLFYAFFNFLVVRAKDKQVEHVNAESTMKQLNTKYLDPDTFEPWVDDVFNRERKIKQHIRNVKYRIKVLEDKTDFKIRKKFKTYFDNYGKEVDGAVNLLPVPYVTITKAEKKYLDAKEELLIKLTDDYINNYAVYETVKYFKPIRPGFVYSGINIETPSADEYSDIKSDAGRIKESMRTKILITLSVTFAFASLLTILRVDVMSQPWQWIVITVLSKVTPLALQIYFAIDYSNWFMENQLLPNLKARYNIAMMYLAEMKRNGTINKAVVIEHIDLGGDPNAKKN